MISVYTSIEFLPNLYISPDFLRNRFCDGEKEACSISMSHSRFLPSQEGLVSTKSILEKIH